MRLGLLGPLVIHHGGAPIAVPAARQRTLLAVLLVNANHVVSADELADIVWDGTPPATARVTVRGYVRRLRLLLGPAMGARIITRATGYTGEFDAAELDLLRFDELYTGGGAALRAGSWPQCSEALGAALRLWRDKPLCDVPCPRLQREEVPRLDQMRLQAIEWRTEAELHLGRHDVLIPELRNLVAEQPLRERFHAQLMTALSRSGRQAEALAAYQQARQVLVEELGIEPGPELRELHQRVLRQEPEPEPERAGLPPSPAAEHVAVPRQLPSPVRHFVGRQAELDTLTELLEEAGREREAVVVSAISGTPGVGKTALAVHFARRAAGCFGDGQLYVNLHGFGPEGTPVSPAEAIRGFLDAFGIPLPEAQATLDAQAAAYRSLLADKRILILLDNARDEKQVRPLLPSGPGCLVIVTSRNELAGLAATEGARLLSLDVLADAEAREMLDRHIGPTRTHAEPRAVNDLTRLCAQLPLALAVGAARANARPRFPLAVLADELCDAAGRLDALDTGDPAATVRAVFSWSYRNLNAATATMFRFLGLHPGPDISVPAAASLAAVSVDLARGQLAELARCHLLNELTPGRYAAHDLLRAYATEQSAAVDDEAVRRSALARVLDHYLRTAHAAVYALYPSREPSALPPAQPGACPEQLSGHRQAVAWFEAEYQVLLSAIALAARAGFDVYACGLPWAIWELVDRRGNWQAQDGIQRIALAAAIRLDDKARQATIRRLLALACARLAQYHEALGYLAESLEFYQQRGDRLGEARIHQSFSWVLEHQDRPADALRHGEQALSLFQALDHRIGQAVALNTVGWNHALLGDHEPATTFCRQALTLSRELGNRLGEAAAWHSLGYAEHGLGRLGQAVVSYQHAITIMRELGDYFHEAKVLNSLGDTHRAAGDLLLAREAWQQAVAILDRLHHPDADPVRAKLTRPYYGTSMGAGQHRPPGTG
jgi:DNA-binding SARP family transcriptional activator